jgi:hypothetical protein
MNYNIARNAKPLIAGVLVAASMLVAAPVKASLVQNGFINGSINVTLNRPGQSSQSVAVGGYTGLLNGAAFLSYCIELAQQVSFRTTYSNYTVGTVSGGPNTTVGGMGEAKASDIAKLSAAYFATSFATTTRTAAFQLAVWEIVHETLSATYNVNSGSFAILSDTDHGAARAQANTWLASLDSLTATAPMISLTSPTAQDFITAVVPVPSSAVLFAGGLLLGLWGMRGIARKKHNM